MSAAGGATQPSVILAGVAGVAVLNGLAGLRSEA